MRVPQKRECGVNGQFVFTFLKLVMGVLETTFWIQITFGLVGRGLKWSKLTLFCKGQLVGMNRKAKQ